MHRRSVVSKKSLRGKTTKTRLSSLSRCQALQTQQSSGQGLETIPGYPKTPTIFILRLFYGLDATGERCIIVVFMTNYHLKPPQDQLPSATWQEKKEKRRRLLEEIRRRRRILYRKLQNRHKAMKPGISGDYRIKPHQDDPVECAS